MKTKTKKTAKRPEYLTPAFARKLRGIVACGLSHDVGEAKPGKMCVEAAVCYALGLPHGDNPPCVGREVREAKIRLNDADGWSSNKVRARGMSDAAIAQLGSKRIGQKKFARRYAELVVRHILPIALQNDAKKASERTIADALKDAALKCTKSGNKTVAGEIAMMFEAGWASNAAGEDLESALANGYAESASEAVEHVAATSKNPSKVLSLGASLIVQALRDCGSPGVKLLRFK